MKLKKDIKNFTTEVLNSEQPVVLFFTITDNAAVDIINKRIYKVLQNYWNVVKSIQLDYEKYFLISKNLRVKDIPLVLLFSKGQVVESLSVMIDEIELDQAITKLVNHNYNKI